MRGNHEQCVMHLKSDNIEIMVSDEADEVIKNFLIHVKVYIKIIYYRWKVVSLFHIMLGYCITNVINQIQIVVDHISLVLIG